MEGLVEFVGKVLGAVFGSQNERMLKRFWKRVYDEINPLEQKFSALADSEFPKKTEELKSRLAGGATLDEILPEAFALCREAAKRTVNMRHFDVQLIGGMVLHEGKIAEMATGEGKTLVATLAAYLNALEGKGVHVVTVNDYLARRDPQWMGPIYDFLGISVASIQHEEAFIFDRQFNPDKTDKMHDLRPCTRKEAYLADITYGTNNEFGFDYLRDNMRVRLEEQCQRSPNYAIVDEVDSILIDEARTPLIISGPSEESTEKYYAADRVVRRLKVGEDYEVKEKEHAVLLTEGGMVRAEQIAGVGSFYEGANMDWPHFIEQALKAHNLFRRDKDYVNKDGEIIIVDEFTGRMMPGRRWSDGLHQAVEAKEGIQIREENQTLATVTLQNYFKMYKKLAGMTGTAATEAVELEKVYKVEVVVIPTNRNLIRTNFPDVIYGTEKEKFDAVEEEIAKIHQTGRPVLVGTTSIEKSEILSERLKMRGIKHEVLNAKYHEKEAYIVARAGQKDEVTISTNMAGRGTDILLGEGVAALGGLHIIGTERHEARRIDNQLRGRAGRQGDPGSSQFFLSLDDELFRKFAPPWIRQALVKLGLKDGEAIQSRMVTRAIEKAQKNVENHNFDMRKNLLEYDAVMNEQRKVIYGLRQNILEGKEVRQTVLKFIKNRIYAGIDRFLPPKVPQSEWDYKSLADWFSVRFGVRCDAAEIDNKQFKDVEDILIEKAEKHYTERVGEISDSQMSTIERLIMLDKIDSHWKEHLFNMDQLRSSVGLRGYGQMDPKMEYKREGAQLFLFMMASIEESVAELVFRVQKTAIESAQEKLDRRWKITNMQKDEFGQFDSTKDMGNDGGSGGAPPKSDQKPRPFKGGEKQVGRNDPCPCGSGKKYKKCHGT